MSSTRQKPKIQIRLVTNKDKGFIKKELKENTFTEKWWKEKDKEIYIITRDGKPVGYIINYLLKTMFIRILKEYRNQKIGQESLKLLPKDKYFTWVDLDNPISQACCKKAGYKEIGVKLLLGIGLGY